MRIVRCLTFSHLRDNVKKMQPWAFAVLLVATGLRAQEPQPAGPDFVWEGEVNKGAVLYLRGDHLEVTNVSGGSVTHQRYRFFHLTPDSHQTVRLEIREARGAVQITQQPTLENDYTIAVAIEDRQEGQAHYSISLYWDAPADEMQQGARKWQDRGWQGQEVTPKSKPSTVKLRWSGHVDGEAMVECRASACQTQVVQGMPVTRERVRFEKPLPEQEVAVSLAGEGAAAGDIRVVQQPLRSNGYAVRVAISNGCDGRKDCRFTLEWQEPGAGVVAATEAAHRGLVWSARVSGTARVTVRDGSTLSGVTVGGSITDERTIFDRPLPHLPGFAPAIRKIQGRGTVSIAEAPSAQNGFSLVFEVDDPGPGAGNYVVELDW